MGCPWTPHTWRISVAPYFPRWIMRSSASRALTSFWHLDCKSFPRRMRTHSWSNGNILHSWIFCFLKTGILHCQVGIPAIESWMIVIPEIESISRMVGRCFPYKCVRFPTFRHGACAKYILNAFKLSTSLTYLHWYLLPLKPSQHVSADGIPAVAWALASFHLSLQCLRHSDQELPGWESLQQLWTKYHRGR